MTEHNKQTHKSLEDKAFDRDDCNWTLADVISSGSEHNADWSIRCEQAIDSMKAKVKSKFFPQAADLWADYVIMKEQGYALHDIAQKHKLTEEKVKSLIKDINHFLTTH